VGDVIVISCAKRGSIAGIGRARWQDERNGEAEKSRPEGALSRTGTFSSGARAHFVRPARSDRKVRPPVGKIKVHRNFVGPAMSDPFEAQALD